MIQALQGISPGFCFAICFISYRNAVACMKLLLSPTKEVVFINFLCSFSTLQVGYFDTFPRPKETRIVFPVCFSFYSTRRLLQILSFPVVCLLTTLVWTEVSDFLQIFRKNRGTLFDLFVEEKVYCSPWVLLHLFRVLRVVMWSGFSWSHVQEAHSLRNDHPSVTPYLFLYQAPSSGLYLCLSNI